MAFPFPKSIQIILLSSMLFMLHSNAQTNSHVTMTSFCSNDSSSITFNDNRDLLVTYLSSNITRTGFYNTSVGEIPNRVYGLAQCTGPVPSTTCLNCINTAIENVHESCHEGFAGMVLRDDCLLRYSNESFFSVVDTSPNSYSVSAKNVSDPARFGPFFKEMFRDLARKAAFDPSSDMFATGNEIFSSNETVHGVVQCTRDLSADDCNTCLQGVIDDVLRCCYASQEVGTIRSTCNLQYQVSESEASASRTSRSLSSVAAANLMSFEVFVLLLLLVLLAD